MLLFKKLKYKNTFRSSLLKEIIVNHLVRYPTPINLNYFWGFGSLAGLCLVIQLITGIFLNMYYIPSALHTFEAVEYIMREVNYGWFFRYMHANGASLFFLVIYIHIGRALYFRSYVTGQLLWYSGILIFVLLMAVAFLGYVLPWGQMSFWGATVITGILGSIPIIGDGLVIWIWGDSNVSTITLYRFLVLHYTLGFVVVGLSVIHLALLHEVGSNQPLKTTFSVENIPFYPNYLNKDSIGFIVLFIIFIILISYYPNILGHPDNYIKANPMVTPPHIVPEWYFLPFYAALRSIENKVLGVVIMGGLILSLFFIPFIDKLKLENPQARLPLKKFFWIWIFTWIILGFLGAKPLESPFIEMHKPLVSFFYLYLIFLLRYFNWLETKTINYIIECKKKSINKLKNV